MREHALTVTLGRCAGNLLREPAVKLPLHSRALIPRHQPVRRWRLPPLSRMTHEVRDAGAGSGTPHPQPGVLGEAISHRSNLPPGGAICPEQILDVSA